jgi:hypothetical protein
VTDWWRIRWGLEYRRRQWMRRAERVVGRENNGLKHRRRRDS